MKCEGQRSGGGWERQCGVVFCQAFVKKGVNHFADSEEKSPVTQMAEKGEDSGKNYAEANLFFTLQNQLGKTENTKH